MRDHAGCCEREENLLRSPGRGEETESGESRGKMKEQIHVNGKNEETMRKANKTISKKEIYSQRKRY